MHNSLSLLISKDMKFGNTPDPSFSHPYLINQLVLADYTSYRMHCISVRKYRQEKINYHSVLRIKYFYSSYYCCIQFYKNNSCIHRFCGSGI